MMKLVIDVAEKVCKRFDVGFIYGKVTSVDPLKIKVDDRYEIDKDFIVLSGFCKETIVKIPVDDENEHVHQVKGSTKRTILNGPLDGTGAAITDAAGHIHEIDFDSQKALPDIMLWRGLEKGDIVRMLRFTSASVHYVIERETGVTNDPKNEG